MSSQRRRISIPIFLSAMLLGSLLTGGLLYVWNGFVLFTPEPFQKLISFYQVLEQEYVDQVDPEKLVDGAISGMLEATEDPYTTYMTEEESEAFQESISNEFEGIGAEVREVDGKTTIVSPIKNSPAEAAGLRQNDIILEVNGTSLSGKSIEESVALIRGPKGSEVKLLIERPGVEEPFELTIVRDRIPLESVYVTMHEDGIAQIQISKFSETTSGEFEEALNQVKEEGAKGIILDLRQNPGGLLHQVVAMTEKFVPEGELMLQVRDRNGATEAYRSNSGEMTEWPIVVLVDGGSASASEIMAAALKEAAGITLIGETTFGKGTVQTTVSYKDGSMMKYTTAEWLTPDGNQIHGKGIEPQVQVSLPEYANLPFISMEETLSIEDYDASIAIAQKYLEALGYQPGRTDGYMDQSTSDAISAFQEAQGLDVTGTLDNETATAMMVQLKTMIQENDTQLAKAKEVLVEQLNGQ